MRGGRCHAGQPVPAHPWAATLRLRPETAILAAVRVVTAALPSDARCLVLAKGGTVALEALELGDLNYQRVALARDSP
jgi:hypothetical protein